MNITKVPTYFINLDSDTDKRSNMETLLGQLGFTDVTRMPGVEHENSRVGCTLAHAKALRQALRAKTPYFLILEDDLCLQNANLNLNIPADAHAAYLGISRWGIYNGKGHRQISLEPYNKDFYRIYNMLSAHAILYTSREYPAMLLRAYDFYASTNDVQDKANAELMKYFNVYALANPVFYQAGLNEPETNFQLPGPRAVGKTGAMTLR